LYLRFFLPIVFTVLSIGLASSLQEAYAGENGFCDPGETPVVDGNSVLCMDVDELDDMSWFVDGQEIMDEQDLLICELIDVNEGEGPGPPVFECDGTPISLGEFNTVEGSFVGEGAFQGDFEDSLDLDVRVVWDLIGGLFGSFESTLEETIEFRYTGEGTTNYRFFQRTDIELSDDDDNNGDIGQIINSALAKITSTVSLDRPPLEATITTSPSSDNFMVGTHNEDDGDDVQEFIDAGELRGNAGPFGPADVNTGFSWDFTLTDVNGGTFTIEKTKQITPIRGAIVEVHCEDIFHRYSTSGLSFDGLTIIGGSGLRSDDGIGKSENECTYLYASGFSETVRVSISGAFDLSPPGSVCDDESSPSSFLETHVSGTIIITDEDGNILVLNHEADLCRFFFLEETPGGTGTVGVSTGIFAGIFGTVETHRTISTSASEVRGDIWVIFNVKKTSGGGIGEPPTIGMNMAGTKLIVTCGVNFDGQCFTITAPFHEEFKLYEMMSGTHTISITMYCPQGVQTCNYAGIGIMPYSESMDNTTWKIEVYKDFEGNLTTEITDPEGYLGTVTITTQILDDKFWVVSYTVDFKNKDTGPMMFGVQARDDNYTVRNWYLNEGVMFIDSDAYPSIETEFEKYLEIDSLCLNEDPTSRYSCAFAENRDLATQLAEDTVRQMLNGEYIYK